jgi:hypothetical protein
VTPVAIDNRPGLDAISRRVGTHALFLESMLARLATIEVTAELPDPRAGQRLRPLRALTTRATDDPAIALLDAWALVADVLTFYQERIANEGYLRTATERRSVLELARLVGYRLRPGVAASVYRGFTVDKDASLIVPRGTRAQSVPAPSETMESFETSDALDARAVWNVLCPRRTAPDYLQFDMPIDDLYLRGAATGLNQGDLLLLDFGGRSRLHSVRALEVEPDTTCSTVGTPPQRTHVELGPFPRRPVIRVRPIPRPVGDVRVAAVAALNEARAELAAAKPRKAVAVPITEGLDEIEQTVRAAPNDRAAMLMMERFVSALGDEQASAAAKRRDDLESLYARVASPIGALTAAARGRAQARSAGGGGDEDGDQNGQDRTDLAVLLDAALVKAQKATPLSAARLARAPSAFYGRGTNAAPALLATLNPRLGEQLYQAWRKAKSPADDRAPQEVWAFRVKAAPFGHNAPWPTHFDTTSGETQRNPADWVLDEPDSEAAGVGASTVKLTVLALDSVYDGIIPGRRVAVVRAGGDVVVRTVINVDTVTRAAYGMSARVTQLTLDGPWIVLNAANLPSGARQQLRLTPLRSVTVYAQSEPLPLAERPVGDELSGGVIELDGLFDGLEAGRWVIVVGERLDLPGVEGRELAMIAGVSHVPRTVPRWGETEEVTLPGERVHTRLTLADPLAFAYRLDTVKVWGNVAKATHGETRVEVLGAGDATVALQTFALRNHPLTYVSAPTSEGAVSTLEVRVNDVRWHEAGSLSALSSAERGYVTDTDDDGTTRVTFGDGEHGARLPTGAENVRAVYRSGIGKPGNVRAEQISLLATRPLGLKDVVNPLRATGGADPDSRDQARRNTPLVTRALGRLVSVEDYADFARTFAGIGKASATSLTDGRRRIVHVTVAGVDDAPLDEPSELIANLRQALRDFGDPYQPFVVAVRELRALVVAARVRIDPDYLWEKVEAAVRTAMLGALGFERRELGQDVTSSEVIAAMARVSGVIGVDLDVLAGFSEADVRAHLATLDRALVAANHVRARLARVTRDSETHVTTLEPAQLAMLTPAIPDTLILNQWTP